MRLERLEEQLDAFLAGDRPNRLGRPDPARAAVDPEAGRSDDPTVDGLVDQTDVEERSALVGRLESGDVEAHRRATGEAVELNPRHVGQEEGAHREVVADEQLVRRKHDLPESHCRHLDDPGRIDRVARFDDRGRWPGAAAVRRVRIEDTGRSWIQVRADGEARAGAGSRHPVRRDFPRPRKRAAAPGDERSGDQDGQTADDRAIGQEMAPRRVPAILRDRRAATRRRGGARRP